MKKVILLLTAALAAFTFTGCFKIYKDVQTPEYATLQLMTKGEPFSWTDVVRANLFDYSKGCSDMVDLGWMGTRSTEPGEIAKIPADIPLLLKISYEENKGRNQYIEYIDVILTPEKKNNYIVEYEKEVIEDKTHTKFNFYTKKGEKMYSIPEERIHEFNSRDCM